MKSQLLSQALARVENPHVLVNMVSQRVRQLGQGHKALVLTEVNMSYMDVALKEIAEGKLGYELQVQPPPQAERPKVRKRKAAAH